MKRFPSHLAAAGRVRASTRNRALSALLFLYRDASTTMIHTHVPNRVAGE